VGIERGGRAVQQRVVPTPVDGFELAQQIMIVETRRVDSLTRVLNL
jgi:hypothetical protein